MAHALLRTGILACVLVIVAPTGHAQGPVTDGGTSGEAPHPSDRPARVVLVQPLDGGDGGDMSSFASVLRSQMPSETTVRLVPARPDTRDERARLRWGSDLAHRQQARAVLWLEHGSDSERVTLWVVDRRGQAPRIHSLASREARAFDRLRTLAIAARTILKKASAEDAETGAEDGETSVEDAETGAEDGETSVEDAETGAEDGETSTESEETGVEDAEEPARDEPVRPPSEPSRTTAPDPSPPSATPDPDAAGPTPPAEADSEPGPSRGEEAPTVAFHGLTGAALRLGSGHIVPAWRTVVGLRWRFLVVRMGFSFLGEESLNTTSTTEETSRRRLPIELGVLAHLEAGRWHMAVGPRFSVVPVAATVETPSGPGSPVDPTSPDSSNRDLRAVALTAGATASIALQMTDSLFVELHAGVDGRAAEPKPLELGGADAVPPVEATLGLSIGAGGF